MYIKDILIKIIRGGAKIITWVQLPFANRKCGREPEQAMACLREIRTQRPCTVEWNSRLTGEYDLMIVIPAYNVQDYIEECMDSVLHQVTQYVFQVVVIEDGSTDHTGERLEKYESDPRVRVIRQKNSGIACARNAGLETITGRYVMFVDSDDVLCPDAIQKLLQKADRLDADIVEGSKYAFNENGSVRWRVLCEDTEEDADFLSHRGVPWGCVIRAEIFRNLKFPDGFEYEDSIMSYCVFPTAGKKCCISHMVYAYRHNKNSISHTASETPGCIDTYYVSLALWKWYVNRFEITESFQLLVLRQIAINYNRTAHWGTEVLESGYRLERAEYMKMFPDARDLKGEYQALDRAIRKNNWGQVSLLCRRWNFLRLGL